MAGRKSDLVSVVLVGTEETDNPLAANGGGDYQHVTLLNVGGSGQPFSQPSAELLRSLMEVQPGSVQTDCIDGLIVAADALITKCKKLKFEKRIYVLTDACSPINKNGMDQVVSTIRDNEIQVKIVGMDFTELDDDEEEESQGQSSEQHQDESVKTENERFLKELARKHLANTESDIFTLEEAMEELHSLRTKPVNPTTVFRGTLSLGDKFEIPIFMYNRTTEMKLPSAKKVVTSKNAITGKEEVVPLSMERTYRVVEKETKVEESDIVDMDAPDTAATTPPKSKKPKLGKEVDRDLTQNAYKYGNTWACVPATFLSEIKTTRGMHMLGFCPMSQLPRDYYLSNVAYVIAEPGIDSAALAMNALIRGLQDTDCCVLVQYCKSDGVAVKLAALIPCLKEDKYQLLHFVQIPFAEDIRELAYLQASLPSLPVDPEAESISTAMKRKAPSVEQLNAAEEFIRSMDLMCCQVDEEGDFVEMFKPSHVFNPTYHRVYQCIEERALHPDVALPPPSSQIRAQLADAQALVERDSSMFKKAFPLEKVPPKGSKRGKKQGGEEGAAAVVPIKSLSEMLQIERQEILQKASAQMEIASNPLVAFEELLNANDDFVTEAVELLCSRVIKLLETTTMDSSSTSLVPIVKRLREVCATENEAQRFNQFLRTVKERHFEFLLSLNQSGAIGLITKLEAQDSDVTLEDADKFLPAQARGSINVDEAETEAETEI